MTRISWTIRFMLPYNREKLRKSVSEKVIWESVKNPCLPKKQEIGNCNGYHKKYNK